MAAQDMFQTLIVRLKDFGFSGVVRRIGMKAAQRAESRFGWADLSFPLRPEDIESLETVRTSRGHSEAADRLRVAWVCAPPGAGSGGHTTLFRMVEAMESRGHECTLLLYERDSDEAARHELLIRANWPQISARVASATTSHQRFDAIVASSWVSAHVVSRRFADVINKFYFIQDYEPYFYPRGYLYTLAEMTYEFGFMNIALGEMVANEIRTRNSIDPELTVPFGCDNDVYQIKARATGTLKRNGVVYYAKQSVDRRGYLLAKAALERFHELCPDQEIHIVGDKIRGWKIPVINHGSMRPSDLNDLYNCTIAGLAMSFTNVSLVPGELLAAGNVPVLNSDPDVQRDLASSEVIWAAPNPEALARGLVKAVSRPELEEHARRAGAGAPVGWGAAQQMVTEFIESQTGAPSENTSSGNLPIVAQTQESPLRHVE